MRATSHARCELARECNGYGSHPPRQVGGANVIQQCLNADLIDEFTVHIAPVVLGAGIRLFDDLDRSRFAVEIVDAVHSDPVVHVHCKVSNR
jgi:riboflavin biosynthesis pyrimidine reductase